MKQLAFVVILLLLSISFPTSLAAHHKVPRYLHKESTVDMSGMNHIFVGWVDLDPDAWALYDDDVRSKAEWTEIIASLNANFARTLQVTYLPGRTITSARDRLDENAAGNELYIKFSKAQVDYDNYHLILSIHFIDPKANAELAIVPLRPYFGDASGLRSYLRAALDEVGVKLQVEVTGEALDKKKKQ